MKLYYVTYVIAINAASTQFFTSEELAMIASEIDTELYGEYNYVSSLEIRGENIVVPQALTPQTLLGDLLAVCDDSDMYDKYFDRVKELM